jgi:adenosine deaminase
MTAVPASELEFHEALVAREPDRFVDLPKADRHCHSLLGASLRSIREWTGAAIPATPARMSSFEQMRGYLHRELYPYIRTRAGFEFTAERSVEEAIQDGVRILEMSLDVDFARFFDGPEEFLGFIRGLVDRHRDLISFRPELGISKNRPPATQIPLAEECVRSGLFASLDLYGNEGAAEPEAYAALYALAARRGLKPKAHVGEFGSPDLMERTMRVLGLREIQHGVAAARSAPLMRVLRREGIRLNTCPGSNVALSASPDLAHHQIRTLFDSGVRVSINTDDRTIFARAVSDEYRALHAAGTLDAAALYAIWRDSLVD